MSIDRFSSVLCFVVHGCILGSCMLVGCSGREEGPDTVDRDNSHMAFVSGESLLYTRYSPSNSVHLSTRSGQVNVLSTNRTIHAEMFVLPAETIDLLHEAWLRNAPRVQGTDSIALLSHHSKYVSPTGTTYELLIRHCAPPVIHEFHVLDSASNTVVHLAVSDSWLGERGDEVDGLWNMVALISAIVDGRLRCRDQAVTPQAVTGPAKHDK